MRHLLAVAAGLVVLASSACSAPTPPRSAVPSATPSGPATQPAPPQTEWKFTQHNPFKAVYETPRRSIYLMTQRITRHPFLAIFDGADPATSTGARLTTTTPVQALYLLNDPFVHEQSKRFAARVLA